MKKRIYKIFRRIRRDIARFIVGYERCPADCRKNYLRLTAVGIEKLVIVAGAVWFFSTMILSFA